MLTSFAVAVAVLSFRIMRHFVERSNKRMSYMASHSESFNVIVIIIIIISHMDKSHSQIVSVEKMKPSV